MANIEYKSEKEKYRKYNFNPYLASLEEVNKYIADCDKKLSISRDSLYWTIAKNYGYNPDLKNQIYDEKATYEHFERVFDGALSSSPFDESIIKNNNVKAVDELKLYDFKNESDFRDALKSYYEILSLLYEFEFCKEAKQQKNK